MISTYPACFFKEEEGYSVVFPDLDFLATCGDTFNDAFSMATECLAGYLYRLQIEGDVAPEPSMPEQINIEGLKKELEIDTENYFVNMVGVDVSEYARVHFEKSVKKTLTIPAWLNSAAIEKNINFSQVLQEALKQKLFPNGVK